MYIGMAATGDYQNLDKLREDVAAVPPGKTILVLDLTRADHYITELVRKRHDLAVEIIPAELEGISNKGDIARQIRKTQERFLQRCKEAEASVIFYDDGKGRSLLLTKAIFADLNCVKIDEAGEERALAQTTA